MSRLGIASLLNKYTMNKDKVYRELKKVGSFIYRILLRVLLFLMEFLYMKNAKYSKTLLHRFPRTSIFLFDIHNLHFK